MTVDLNSSSGSICMADHQSSTDAVGKRPEGSQSVSSSVGKAPPYWQARQRTVSSTSYQSLQDRRRPIPITLEDHTELQSDTSRSLWAKHITIDEYTFITGNQAGVGAYVVWHCTVDMLDGGQMKIRKRYSEFDKLRRGLVETFPQSAESMPQLPPKSIISRFRPRFLEKRREGLAYFLNSVMLHPEFAGSPVLKEFVFS